MKNKKEYLFNVEIFYKDGSHKYYSVFSKEIYDIEIEIGNIIGYREMKWYEKIIFRIRNFL